MNNKVVKNVNGQVAEGVGFERIRRITGYLVGTMDQWNNAKSAEELLKYAGENGGEITEDKKSEIMENMAAMEDAKTGGLAVFSRRADELENKLN